MASTTTTAQPGQEYKDAADKQEADRKAAERERSARRRAEKKKATTKKAPAKKKAAPAKRAATKKPPASHTKGTCPTCGARSGQVCTYPRGVERKKPHRTRGQ